MYRSNVTSREKNNRLIKQFDQLQMSKAMQRRFELMPTSVLNKVTVADVRDMSLGRLKDGLPVGETVVRLKDPNFGTKSDFHQNHKGALNKGNLHKPVVKSAESAFERQKALKLSEKVLLVVSIVTAGFRIDKTIYDQVGIDSEIDALQSLVACLKEDLGNNPKNLANTEEALGFAANLLEDAHDYRRNSGKKTVLTCLVFGGEFSGRATALAYACAQCGAVFGSLGGPVGAIGGALTGGLIGALAGTELGTSAVQNFRCNEDGLSTEMEGSLVDFGDRLHGQVLGLDGHVYAGKGVEVGARVALFQMVERGEGSFSLGKVGANFGATDRGLEVALEGKLIWTEIESERVKVGVGLNVDTGFRVTEDGVNLSLFGFGFSVGKDGFGLKLPLLNVTWK